MFPEKSLILLFNTLPKYTRIIVVLGIINMVGMSLSGCGFEPLYGKRAAPGLSSLFSTIQIQQPGNNPDNDLNRAVYNALAKTLKLEGKPRYRLDVIAGGNKAGVLMDNNSREARTRYMLKVHYSLYDIKEGTIATSGSASSSTSFNVNVSEYANLVALESAEARTAKAVAEKIVLKLGGWHKPMAQ